MTDKSPIVLYNGTCPICAPEIRNYARAARDVGADLTFQPIDETDLARYGLTRDQAARRLHVVQGGALVSGLDAFVLIWARLPRWRHLARALDRPVVRPVAAWIYDRLLAPPLYAMDRRRRAR